MVCGNAVLELRAGGDEDDFGLLIAIGENVATGSGTLCWSELRTVKSGQVLPGEDEEHRAVG